MKKIKENTGIIFPMFKIDLKLKLTTLLFLVAMFNVKANTYAQDKVSLDLNNTTVEKVIEAIEQKTDFRFIYNTNDVDLDRTISISVRNKEIDDVLTKIFKGTGISYKVRGSQIILKKPFGTATGAMLKETIKGKVVDENGIPLPGATVLEEGTHNAVSTDADGNFEIVVENRSAVLVISFVSYTTKKLPASEAEGTIALAPNTNELSEVVVVGYGTQNRKDVTGAVGSVQAKDMNQGAITSPLQLIGGKLAGVNVNQVGSEPGSAPSVRIRGISSLVGGSDPLVVIDGVQGNLELLSTISPSEIASIDVLKDASATAVYGSRGAPGVILVTTKRSKAGTTTVEFSSTTSYDYIPKKLDMLNAGQWWAEAQRNGVPASANHGANTDWYNLLTRGGSTQNHSLSFGGGTDKFNYRASVNAILQDGVVINSSNKRYIGRIQVQQLALQDKLKLTFNLNSTVGHTNSMVQSIGRAAFTSNLITNAYVMRPTDPIYNTDGTYYTDPNLFQYLNPYAVAQTTTNENENNSLFGNLRADLDIYGGLSAAWFGSWRKTDTMTGYFIPVESTSATAIDQKGYANVSNNRQNEKLMDMSLTYKKQLGDHNIDALGLYEWQNQTYQGNFAQARGFVNDIQTYNALQLGDITKAVPGDVSSYKNDRTMVSFLGRVNYSFKGRYLLTASMRRDGSSVFGANYKWGNFPSVSLGWQIDQESFMANQKVVSSLKLRGGYGVTGNSQGLSPQNSISLVGIAPNTPPITYFGGQPITNYNITQNSNPNLRWETKKQSNFGVDFGFMKDRLRGTVDVFRAVTDNLLFNYTVPQPPNQYNVIFANVGSMLNKGLEASLAYDLIKTDNTTLTLAGNATFLKNEVLYLGGLINGSAVDTDYVGWGTNNFLIKGQPIGTFYIMHHTGKDGENSETVQDVNGDGKFDQGSPSQDRLIKGQITPKYTFSFNPTIRYKNFDASMLWRGSGGNMIYNSLRSSLSYEENIGKSNLLASAVPLGLRTSKYASDLWLEKGDFIRLDNLTAGYTFRFAESKYMDTVRISLTGNNLALITKYSGLDPELNFSGGSNTGYDNGIYPRNRSFVFGLNVKFK